MLAHNFCNLYKRVLSLILSARRRSFTCALCRSCFQPITMSQQWTCRCKKSEAATSTGAVSFSLPNTHARTQQPNSYETMATAEDKERKLLEPYAYICKLPGKNVRTRMVDAFQQWLYVPESSVAVIKSIVDELHNASLLCVLATLSVCLCVYDEPRNFNGSITCRCVSVCGL